MAKLVLLTLCAVMAEVLGEPPSSYLPPQARNRPSSLYGAPNGGFRSNGNGHGGGHSNGNGKASSFHSQRTGSQSFSYNSLHENQFGGSQRKPFGSSKFNGASNGFGSPSRSYALPSRSGNGVNLSQQYGTPSNGFGPSALSQQYGSPGFENSGDSFGGYSNGFGASAPSQQYGTPNSFGTSGFGSSINGFSSYKQGSSFSAKSNSFASRLKSGNGNGNGYASAPVYGTPSAGYGYSKMDDDLAEPANYEYTYEVQAGEESGAEFGHQESREDEAAKGVYHVLLPDGRTQIVEYEADEEGFRPQIRYEEPTGYPEAKGSQGPY